MASARPVGQLERQIIEHLLSVRFDGVETLREQLRRVSTVRDWTPPGSLSFDIDVPAAAPIYESPRNLAPISDVVHDDAGAVIGEFLLWLEKGRLSALEYAWVSDQPPGRLPSVSNVRVEAHRGG